MRDDIHDGHSWDFSYPSLQILIACGNNETAMLLYPLHDAIISISALVCAFQALESWILRDAKGKAILYSKFLEFCYHAISDIGDALAQETVHAGLEDVQLVLDRKVDEVCIDQDAVWWTKSVVMCKEEA